MREVQRQKGGQAEGHRDVVKTIADRSAQRSGRPKARSGRGPGCFASVLQYGAAADEADAGNQSFEQARLGRRCASENGDTDEHETATGDGDQRKGRSEEHTSELQSLMRHSYTG